MFAELEKINSRPEPFQYYTAEELWTDSPSLRFGGQAREKSHLNLLF